MYIDYAFDDNDMVVITDSNLLTPSNFLTSGEEEHTFE